MCGSVHIVVVFVAVLMCVCLRPQVVSMVMGDTLESWRTEPFQMTVGGPWWVPPGASTTPSPSPSRTRDSRSVRAVACFVLFVCFDLFVCKCVCVRVCVRVV